MLLNNDEKWDCHQCGFCCRGSVVPLSESDAERLRDQNWEGQPGFEKTKVMVPYRAAASLYRLAHRADGTCVFPGDDGLCRIHSKFGAKAKPTICQTFPLQLVAQDKQPVMTIRRAGPSAAAELVPRNLNRFLQNENHLKPILKSCFA